jgi:hypothetical protein
VATTSEEMRGRWSEWRGNWCRLCRARTYHTEQEHKLALREESREG